MSKPGHDASPQCLKPKENWNSSFMLCHEDTCCFDFQRLLFFHLISDLVMWNFHVLWSWISFKGIGYSSFSSPMQNSCSHTLKNLCYLQCLWIRGGFNVNIDTTAISPVFVIHFLKKNKQNLLYLFWKVFGAPNWKRSLEETDWSHNEEHFHAPGKITCTFPISASKGEVREYKNLGNLTPEKHHLFFWAQKNVLSPVLTPEDDSWDCKGVID